MPRMSNRNEDRILTLVLIGMVISIAAVISVTLAAAIMLGGLK